MKKAIPYASSCTSKRNDFPLNSVLHHWLIDRPIINPLSSGFQVIYT